MLQEGNTLRGQMHCPELAVYPIDKTPVTQALEAIDGSGVVGVSKMLLDLTPCGPIRMGNPELPEIVQKVFVTDNVRIHATVIAQLLQAVNGF